MGGGGDGSVFQIRTLLGLLSFLIVCRVVEYEPSQFNIPTFGIWIKIYFSSRNLQQKCDLFDYY